MTCVICGSSELKEIRAAEVHRLEDVSFSYSFSPEHNKTFRVVKCQRCTHAFCAPLPTGITASYEEVTDEEYLKHSASRRRSAEAVLDDVKKVTPTGRLLDVGCATGDFLVAARDRGYQAEGLELSKWSRTLAQKEGFTVHDVKLDQLATTHAGAYDVVSLIGVVEHFPDPLAELKHIATLLKPNGLLVLWTGDSDSILARALGRRWWYWQGQHIQYFTHASMKLVTEMAGLRHVKTRRYPFAATKETITNSLRRYPFHTAMSAVAGPFFDRFPIFLRLPGEMLFFATRESLSTGVATSSTGRPSAAAGG